METSGHRARVHHRQDHHARPAHNEHAVCVRARGAASAEAHLRSQDRENVANYAGYYRNFVPFVIDLGRRRQRRFVWRTQGNHEGRSEGGGPAAPLSINKVEAWHDKVIR